MTTANGHFTSDHRRRLEDLEKTLLDLRRAVAAALMSGGDKRQELELQLGMLQFRIGALTEAGEVSAKACREHARRLSSLSVEQAL